LGKRLRVALADRIAPWEDDEAVCIVFWFLSEFHFIIKACRYILDHCVAIHLTNDVQKFYCLAMMAHKLVGLVKNEVQDESLDNPQFQVRPIVINYYYFLFVL
jgi:hypothetical protein